jgi:hypothetical protein
MALKGRREISFELFELFEEEEGWETGASESDEGTKARVSSWVWDSGSASCWSDDIVVFTGTVQFFKSSREELKINFPLG